MKRVLALLIASLALVAAGCGDDEDNGGSESSGGTATESSGGTAVPASGGDAVTIKGFAFQPADLKVAKGTEVTWTNEDTTAHNVVAGDGTFKSESLGQGDTFSYVADKTGTFEYVCTFHSNMKATLTVTG